MAVTGWKTAGTAANAKRTGYIWNNPNNAKVSNNQYADTWNAYQNSDWLRLTAFGFSSADIPSGSTIDGIEVKIERKSSSATYYAKDNALYLRKTSGQVGDNKADTSTHWPTSDTEASYGGAADTWNASLADTDIISSDFGIDLSALVIYYGVGYVDYVSIRVYYTLGATEKTSSDSGSGADASSVLTATLASLDLGSGVEASTPEAAMASPDSGVGVDASSPPKATLSSSETGSGIDSVLALIVALLSSDLGSGIDVKVSYPTAILEASETGTGIDAASYPTVTITASDLGSGLDSANLIAEHLASDFGIGVEYEVIVTKTGGVTITGTTFKL